MTSGGIVATKQSHHKCEEHIWSKTQNKICRICILQEDRLPTMDLCCYYVFLLGCSFSNVFTQFSDRKIWEFIEEREVGTGDLKFLKEMAGLDFGEDIKFEPSKLLAKFQKEFRENNGSYGSIKGVRFGYRKPQLAVVFANLLVEPQQIMMVTIAAALSEIGYEIEEMEGEPSLQSNCLENMDSIVFYPSSVLRLASFSTFSIRKLERPFSL